MPAMPVVVVITTAGLAIRAAVIAAGGADRDRAVTAALDFRNDRQRRWWGRVARRLAGQVRVLARLPRGARREVDPHAVGVDLALEEHEVLAQHLGVQA